MRGSSSRAFHLKETGVCFWLVLGLLLSNLVLPLRAQNQLRLENPANRANPTLEASRSEMGIELRNLIREKKWNRASKLAAQLVHDYPHVSAFPYWLGVSQLSLGNPVGAIQGMRMAEIKGYKDVYLHIDLGLAYYEIHQYMLFQQEMDEAIKQAPNKFEPYYYLGMYFESTRGDFGSALQYLNHAIKLKPSDGRTWFDKGYCLYKLGKYHDSQNAYESAIKFDHEVSKRSSLPYRGMAQLLLEKEPHRALVFARKAVTLGPNLEANRVVLAKVLIKLGEFPDARSELRNAIRLNPDDASARFLISAVYRRLHDPQAAGAAMETFKKLSQLYEPQ